MIKMNVIAIAFSIIIIISMSSGIAFSWCDGQTLRDVKVVDIKKDVFTGLKKDTNNGNGYSYVMFMKFLKKIKEKYPSATDEQILTSIIFSKYPEYSPDCDSKMEGFVRKYYKKFNTLKDGKKPVVFKSDDIMKEIWIRDSKSRLKPMDPSHVVITMLAHEKESGFSARYHASLYTTIGDNIQVIAGPVVVCKSKDGVVQKAKCLVSNIKQNWKTKSQYLNEADIIADACGTTFSPHIAKKRISLEAKFLYIINECKKLVGRDEHKNIDKFGVLEDSINS